MQPTSTLNYTYVKREIEAAVQKSPVEMNLKIQHLTFRMMTELSLEEIEKMECIVKAELPPLNPTNFVFAMNSSMIKTLIGQVKITKIEINKVEKVSEFFHAAKWDEASTLLNEVSPDFEESVKEIREAIAAKYREKGEYSKADRVLKGKTSGSFIERPSEKVVANTGIELAQSGLDNLRRAYPEKSLTLMSNSQMGEALLGLHEMSAISTGKKTDSTLENESIKSLKQKLKDAEALLNQERLNYDQSLMTRNPDIYMPVLHRKQAFMKEVLSLKQALDKKGESQKEEGDTADILNRTIIDGFTGLVITLEENTPPEDQDNNETCVVS